MLELAGSVVKAVAALHRLPSGLAHGAVTPAHIVLAADGSAVLTDSVFGAALESLEWNREKLWREFHVALPASASLPRFDQRADVTQLGAVVLAIALGRRLRDDEYPRSAADLVIAATSDLAAPGRVRVSHVAAADAAASPAFAVRVGGGRRTRVLPDHGRSRGHGQGTS